MGSDGKPSGSDGDNSGNKTGDSSGSEMLLVRVVLQISKTLMNFHKILEQIVLITVRNMNL